MSLTLCRDICRWRDSSVCRRKVSRSQASISHPRHPRQWPKSAQISSVSIAKAISYASEGPVLLDAAIPCIRKGVSQAFIRRCMNAAPSQVATMVSSSPRISQKRKRHHRGSPRRADFVTFNVPFRLFLGIISPHPWHWGLPPGSHPQTHVPNLPAQGDEPAIVDPLAHLPEKGWTVPWPGMTPIQQATTQPSTFLVPPRQQSTPTRDASKRYDYCFEPDQGIVFLTSRRFFSPSPSNPMPRLKIHCKTNTERVIVHPSPARGARHLVDQISG